MPEDLHLTVDDSSGLHAVVTIQGELDVTTAPQFRQTLMSVVARMYPAVILDLSGVEFIDSSALGVILTAYRQIKAQEGAMAIASPIPRITRILEITGLTLSFPVRPSVAEAVASVASDPKPASPDGAVAGELDS